MKPIYVDFTVPERELPRVRRAHSQGQIQVDATVPDGKPSSGELLVIGNNVQTNTGSITLRAVFANTNELLWPGQFVNVTMTLTTESNVVAVPSQAIQMSQSGDAVFVVAPNQTAEYRTVQTGVRFGDQTVIAKGIKEGEQVVTSGQIRVMPGGKVSVVKTPQPAENSGAGPP